MIDSIIQDLRHAIRGLAKAPMFTAAVVSTLALGIGANAAIFSIFNQALIRALPVPEPEQLVNLSSPGPKPGRTSTTGTARLSDVFSYPLFRDLERAQNAFTGIVAHRDFPANVAYRGHASSEGGRLVSGNYFQVLALRPAAGRLLTPDDDRAPGAHHVIVLSHEFWVSRFNSDPRVIDESLVVNGIGMTIVGVAPRGFVSTTLEDRPQIYAPLSMAGLMIPGWSGFEDRRDHWLILFARLKPGLSREAAERAMSAPFSGIIKDVEFPAQRTGLGTTAREQFTRRQLILEPGKQGQRPERGELSSALLVLFCATGIVLLIACANVANLLLTRAAYHATEINVRLSLGAGRHQLVRQMLLESSLIAVAGALGGVIAAAWTLSMIGSVVPAQVASVFRFEVDSTVLLFTGVISFATVLLIGLYPALHSTRSDLSHALRGATSPGGTRSAARFRTSLATSQIALSLALLAVAGLFTRSLANAGRVELGIQPENLATFRIRPELSGYTPERSHLLADRVEQEMMTLPGVASVGASTIPLLGGVGAGGNLTVEGFTEPSGSVLAAKVGPGYFQTVGIPLLAGRTFAASDNLTAPKVAIVNEGFARKFNLGRNPVGKRMGLGAGRSVRLDIEIVGLVRDARYSQIKEPPPPQYFLSYRQEERFGALNFYVRSSLPADRLVSMIPPVVARVDGMLPVENLMTMTDQLGTTLGLDRFITTLSSAFALLATALAAIGLYGLLSYTVAQRTREIGLRMALGANGGHIQRLIFARVGRMTAIGALIGLVAAVGLGRLARSLLFGLDGSEPIVMAYAAACVALIALGAGAIPARRAARVDPMTALRTE